MFAALAEWSKVNLDLWNLFMAIVTLDKTLSENNDFGFNSFQKICFSKISPFKCIRKQIRP